MVQISRVNGLLECPCGNRAHNRYHVDRFKKIFSDFAEHHPIDRDDLGPRYADPYPEHYVNPRSGKSATQPSPAEMISCFHLSDVGDGSSNLITSRHSTASQTPLVSTLSKPLPMDVDEDLSELVEEGDNQLWSDADLCNTPEHNDGDSHPMDLDQPEDVVMQPVSPVNLLESPFSSDEESDDQMPEVPSVSQLPNPSNNNQQSLIQKHTPPLGDTNFEAARKYLYDHKIVVDPVQRWSICLECHRPVDWNVIHSHRRTEHHSRSRIARIAGAFTDFPSEDQIIPKLLLLGADEPTPYTLCKIHPVDGLEVKDAVKCLFDGCGKIYSSSKTFKTHWKTSDSHTGGPRSTTIQAHPLGGMMYSQQYVEITSSPSNLDPDEAFRQFMARSTESGIGNPPSVAGTSQKASATNDIYNDFKWNQILEGAVFEDVRQSAVAPVPSVDSVYDRIVQGTYDYYWDIIPQLENLGTTVRRWIRSVREA